MTRLEALWEVDVDGRRLVVNGCLEARVTLRDLVAAPTRAINPTRLFADAMGAAESDLRIVLDVVPGYEALVTGRLMGLVALAAPGHEGPGAFS